MINFIFGTVDVDKKLIDSAKLGRWGKVGDLIISNQGNVNVEYRKGDITVVHYAAMDDRDDIILRIKNIRLFINLEDRSGMTPLHYAIKHSKFKAFSALILCIDDSFPAPNYTHGDILAFSIKQYKEDSEDSKKILQDVIFFIKKRGQELDVSDKNGDFPLHLAAKKGSKKVLLTLLACGCQKAITNKNNQTPYDLFRSLYPESDIDLDFLKPDVAEKAMFDNNRSVVSLSNLNGGLDFLLKIKKYYMQDKSDLENIKKIFIGYVWSQDVKQLKYIHEWLSILRNDLVNAGFFVFLDIVDMRGGLQLNISEILRSSDIVIFLCTPDFNERVNRKKSNIFFEVNEALNQDKRVLPILFSDDFHESIPNLLKSYLVMDIKNFYDYADFLCSPKGLLPLLYEIGIGSKAFDHYTKELQNFQFAQLVNLPSRNPNFVGRNKVLNFIQDEFQNKSNIVFLCGISGVGKSQISLEFAHRHYKNPYQFIVWINFENLDNDFTALAKVLRINVKEVSFNQIVRSVYRKISEWKWLLIFDNITKHEDVKPYLPGDEKLDQIHHIIVNSKWIEFSKLSVSVIVDVFSQEESSLFIKKKLEDFIDTDADFYRLGFQLGHMPLALNHAVSYIKQNCISVKEYLLLYKENGIKLLDQPVTREAHERGNFHQAFLLRVLLTSIHEVKKKSYMASELLLTCALLESNISLFLLEKIFVSEKYSKIMLLESITLLQTYGLLGKQEKNDASFRMHKLLCDLVNDQQSYDDQYIIRLLNLIRIIINVISEVHNFDENIEKIYELTSNAEKLLSRYDDYNKNFTIAEIGLPDGYKYQIFFLRLAVEFFKKIPSSDRLQSTDVLADSGEVYNALSEYTKAKTMSKNTLLVQKVCNDDLTTKTAMHTSSCPSINQIGTRSHPALERGAIRNELNLYPSTNSSSQSSLVPSIFTENANQNRFKINQNREKLYNEPEVNEKLSLLISKNYVLGDAISKGDCFYDALALALNQKLNVEEYSAESIRLLCFDYLQDEEKSLWVRDAVRQDGGDYPDFNVYKARVRYTEADWPTEFGDALPVWGRPEIEGRVICSVLGIKIHVIEVREESTEGVFVTEAVVDADGSKAIEQMPVEEYPRERLIHLVNHHNHFVPLLSKQNTLNLSTAPSSMWSSPLRDEGSFGNQSTEGQRNHAVAL